MDTQHPVMMTTIEYISKIMEEEGKEPIKDKQVGGTHYTKKSIQPWDYIHENNLCYFTGNAVKYLSRWKDKGGVEDLKKAIHYIEKLIELEEGK